MARAMAAFVAVSLSLAGTARAGESETDGAAAAQKALRPVPSVTTGHNLKTGWLMAAHRDLQVRKQTDKTTGAIDIELRYAKDVVKVTIASGIVSVSRGGRRQVVNSEKAMESLQQLLAGSSAVFATRALLSELEATSDYQASDMSLLGTAAFVSSLVGDLEAPRRVSDRFVEKHRGIFRQVSGAARSCWGDYASDATGAWDDLQGCMSDANNRGFFRAAYERIACNVIWIARSDSAWLEFLGCVSPVFQ
jgi:hypothetical protein